jgi:ABC-type enterochelin transport system ATPase subunit
MDRQRVEEATKALVSTVSEITTQPHGERVIALENGQVWMQKSLENVIRIKVGDQVTIRRAALGSFMLSPPSGQSIRVTRVK